MVFKLIFLIQSINNYKQIEHLGYELSTHASVHYARRELAQSLRSRVRK